MMVAGGPGTIIVNPNVTGSQVIPVAGQVQNMAGYQQIPVMWNSHHQMLAPGQPSQNFAPTLLAPQQQASNGQYVTHFAAESQPLSSSSMILNNNTQTIVSSLPPQSVVQQTPSGPISIPEASQSEHDEPISDRPGKKRRIAQGGKVARASKAEVSIEGNDDLYVYEADGTKTQLNRERNREHARSTRLRKKVRNVEQPATACWNGYSFKLSSHWLGWKNWNEIDRHTFKNLRIWPMAFVPFKQKRLDNVGLRRIECWKYSMCDGPFYKHCWLITRTSKATQRSGIYCWKTRFG